MKDEALEKLIKKRSPNLGGKRPGAGRKRKMEEYELIEKLSPMADVAFTKLKELIAKGDVKALQIFMSYFVGLPTQKIESKVEGNLNQVSVEVVKPQLEKVA
jgi:hypothetical protein